MKTAEEVIAKFEEYASAVGMSLEPAKVQGFRYKSSQTEDCLNAYLQAVLDLGEAAEDERKRQEAEKKSARRPAKAELQSEEK